MDNLYYKLFKKTPNKFYSMFYNKEYSMYGLEHTLKLMKSTLLYQHYETLPVIDIYIIVSCNLALNILESLSCIEQNYKQKYSFFYWIVLYNAPDDLCYSIETFMLNHRGLACKATLAENIQNKIYMRNVCKYLKSFGERFEDNVIDISDIYKQDTLLSEHENCKYSLVVDEDIYFESECFKELLKSIKKSRKIVMVCPLCVDEEGNTNCYNSEYVVEDDIVHSCYNGVALIRTHAFMNSEWKFVYSNISNEHRRFCMYIRKNGLLKVDSHIRVLKYS